MIDAEGNGYGVVCESPLTVAATGLRDRRLGEPEDVGALCAYLASKEDGWLTAQTLQINGGSTTT